MGNPPDTIFIVRHGARLDAVNPQWHLTSATPYDPPLTYGGWKQAQALGARIGNILHLREAASDQNAPSQQEPSAAAMEDMSTEDDGQCAPRPRRVKRRRQRLVIHTSPFLRCIETAIGISAGLEQYRGSQKSKSSSPSENSHSRHQSMHSRSPCLRARERRSSSHLSAISEPDEVHAGSAAESEAHAQHLPKASLRLDAFLGEWLSPDYFEMITPPPDSKMMMASAKASLLRLKQSEISMNGAGPTLGRGNFPGGWGSDQSTVNGLAKSSEYEISAKVAGFSYGLPKSSPNKSHGNSEDPQKHNSQQERPSQNLLALDHVGYMPLQPAFAVSSLGEIPAGFVAHARDACIEIDYQWDSVRPPQDWGDGGVIGEEWSSMHQRFRRGLQSLITWYRGCRSVERSTYLDGEAASEEGVNVENDEEPDTIAVLVTHGAGCNALIGALTNQPVLLDVGMASLTMAVRKAPTDTTPPISSDTKSTTAQHSILHSEISQEYEMKMIASTDHLYTPRHSSSMSRFYRSSPPTPRTSTRSTYTLFSRPHSASVGSNIVGTTTTTTTTTAMLDLNFSINGNGNDNNTTQQPDPPTHASTTTGLWTKPVAPIENKEMFTRLHHHHHQTPIKPPPPGWSSSRQAPIPPRSTLITPLAHEKNIQDAHANGGGVFEDDDVDAEADDDQRPDSFAMQCGLWGSAPHALATAREKGFKRRWTHSEALA